MERYGREEKPGLYHALAVHECPLSLIELSIELASDLVTVENVRPARSSGEWVELSARRRLLQHEPNERSHIHVDRDDCSAKFWLEPVAFGHNLGFGARELRRIEELVTENRVHLREAWRGCFGT